MNTEKWTAVVDEQTLMNTEKWTAVVDEQTQ